jgi:SAM-dependent methyltransferase
MSRPSGVPVRDYLHQDPFTAPARLRAGGVAPATTDPAATGGHGAGRTAAGPHGAGHEGGRLRRPATAGNDSAAPGAGRPAGAGGTPPGSGRPGPDGRPTRPGGDRVRHRQGAARVVRGVPYSDRDSTLSLLPGAAVGRWLAARADLVHGRLLDLGCGNQPFAGWYGPLADEVVPVDAAPIPGVRQVDLGARLPFADASFDTVLCTQVLEHVDGIEVAAAEIARVLRPGGHALVTVPFLYPTHEAPYDFQRLTHLGLASLARRHGLEVLDVEAQGGPGMLVAHHAVLALTGVLRATRLERVRAVRALVAAPQEALRSRVSTRLSGPAKVASLGYLLTARKPHSPPPLTQP